jgi:hypothetical protein
MSDMDAIMAFRRGVRDLLGVEQRSGLELGLAIARLDPEAAARLESFLTRLPVNAGDAELAERLGNLTNAKAQILLDMLRAVPER